MLATFVRYFSFMNSQPVAPVSFGAPIVGDAPVKLVATDVDGTILSYAQSMTGEVSARTVEAFKLLARPELPWCSSRAAQCVACAESAAHLAS